MLREVAKSILWSCVILNTALIIVLYRYGTVERGTVYSNAFHTDYICHSP